MAIADFRRNGASKDTVGIWRKDFSQFCRESRPMSLSVSESSKNMEHPLENGAVITDHRIVLPVAIDLALIMNGAVYQSQYREMRQAFIAGELFTVSTKTGNYDNMIITDIPHEETPDMADTITVALKMLEVKFVEAQFLPLPPAKVENKANGSTKDKGQLQSAPAPSAQAAPDTRTLWQKINGKK
jgi:hypothetical protein